jgi:His/Glu/Gln/Arg/opine family amino acid ABC transporter permease subunit
MFATGHIWDYWHVFVRGLGLTLALSVLALLAGFVLGSTVAVARSYGPPSARMACRVFTEAFRSTPPLLLFFGSYYGLSYATGVALSPFQASVVAMTLEAAALLSEVVRGALGSVGRGQWDAARALGLHFRAILATVVAPQAVRVMMPPAIGVYVAVLKDSSLASVVGLVELARAGMLVRETVGDSLGVFSLLAVLYFILNFSISSFGFALEGRFRGER